MVLRAKALTAIEVAVVILSLTMLPNWSMAFLILLGMIASAVIRAAEMMKTEPILPVYAPAPAVDAPIDAPAVSVDAPVDAPALAVDALALSVDAPVDAPALAVDARVDAPALSVDAPALAVDALALSVDALALSVDAPALAVDALALSVDAPPLAPAVVAAGIKMRRKPESSSISSSSPGFKYDVYLSTSGFDTSRGITDQLYAQLVDAGIRVFRNEDELLQCKEIWPALKEAIKQSRISTPILSRNCASIKSCLNELVHMWECMKLNGQTILPILYEVSPADVRYQAGDFGRSFNSCEIDRVDSNTIKTCKEVLRQIGKLSGYFGDKRNGPKSLHVKEVVARVVRVLKKDCQVVTDKLVGIDLHVEEMMRKLGVAYSGGRVIEVRGEEVRVVAICNVPGVGKTTLVKVVFNKMHKLFVIKKKD